MKKRILILLPIFAIFSLFSPLFLSENSFAADPYAVCNAPDATETVKNSTICKGQKDGTKANSKLSDRAKNIINVGFFVVGVAAVVVIIVAGLYYIISAGDSGKIKKAKDSLTYAIVGLIIAMAAYAIANYVVDNIA